MVISPQDYQQHHFQFREYKSFAGPRIRIHDLPTCVFLPESLWDLDHIDWLLSTHYKPLLRVTLVHNMLSWSVLKQGELVQVKHLFKDCNSALYGIPKTPEDTEGWRLWYYQRVEGSNFEPAEDLSLENPA